MSKRKKNKQKKFPLWGKILFALLIILAMGVGVTLGTVYKTLSKLDNIDIKDEDLGIVSEEELQQYDNYEKITNIALFGIDSEDGVGRSDSIMIATIDPVHDKLKISSIMRDSYVNIDGHGYDKINHAYAFGSAPLSIKTINETFGLNIQDFVAVDFASLPVIIDMLGGIELNITDEELIEINNIIPHLNQVDNASSPLLTHTGLQKLDGIQAVAYTRIRHATGGDYVRTERQRTVLSSLFNTALTLSPSQYLGLINDVLPLVKTSLGTNDILSLATKVATMGGGTLEQERFPRDGYCQSEMINEVYYLTFDENSTKQQMMDYIFDDK